MTESNKPITRKKLIEVALPLEAINVASAREKSVRRGHPCTLHLWWVRRPLARTYRLAPPNPGLGVFSIDHGFTELLARGEVQT